MSDTVEAAYRHRLLITQYVEQTPATDVHKISEELLLNAIGEIVNRGDGEERYFEQLLAAYAAKTLSDRVMKTDGNGSSVFLNTKLGDLLTTSGQRTEAKEYFDKTVYEYLTGEGYISELRKAMKAEMDMAETSMDMERDYYHDDC